MVAKQATQLVLDSRTVAIGVIGVGIVGGAVRRYFESRGSRVHCYDKFVDIGSVDEVNAADVVFVCVPTPYRSGAGLDTAAVHDAISILRSPKVVVVKSTMAPGATDALQEAFPQHRVFFNPEFLRENSAYKDFVSPDRQLVGYCGGERRLAYELLSLLPMAPYAEALPATAAELIKIETNAFLAMKVIFANELFDLASALGVDYESVRNGLTADSRIGDSHMNVLDGGYRGYAGKCLPKDVSAIIDTARERGTPLHLMETVRLVNARLTLAEFVSAKSALPATNQE